MVKGLVKEHIYEGPMGIDNGMGDRLWRWGTGWEEGTGGGKRDWDNRNSINNNKKIKK